MFNLAKLVCVVMISPILLGCASSDLKMRVERAEADIRMLDANDQRFAQVFREQAAALQRTEVLVRQVESQLNGGHAQELRAIRDNLEQVKSITSRLTFKQIGDAWIIQAR